MNDLTQRLVVEIEGSRASAWRRTGRGLRTWHGGRGPRTNPVFTAAVLGGRGHAARNDGQRRRQNDDAKGSHAEILWPFAKMEAR